MNPLPQTRIVMVGAVKTATPKKVSTVSYQPKPVSSPPPLKVTPVFYRPPPKPVSSPPPPITKPTPKVRKTLVDALEMLLAQGMTVASEKLFEIVLLFPDNIPDADVPSWSETVAYLRSEGCIAEANFLDKQARLFGSGFTLAGFLDDFATFSDVPSPDFL